jgi:DNA-binding CsgD family transcriptional regulator
MARVVVGYEGEGPARRPIYRDDGPARAGGIAEAGVGRFGLASLPDPDRERHQVVAARREVYGRAETWSEERDRKMAARMTADLTASRKEPAMDPARAAAMLEDVKAEFARNETDRSLLLDQASEQLVSVAEAALPCEGCLHIGVCRIRDELLTLSLDLVGTRLPAGITREIIVELRCEYRLATPVVPVAERVEAAMELASALGIAAPDTVTAADLEDAIDRAEAELEALRPVEQAPAAEESAIAWHRDLCRCPQKGTCEPHGYTGENRRGAGVICEPHDHVDPEARSTDAEAEARLARVVAPKADPAAIAARREKLGRTEHASSPFHRRERRAGEIRLAHEEEQRGRAGKHGLTPKQEQAIELLREHDGSQTEVARRLGRKVGAVSSLVKGIRAKGRMPADVEALLAVHAKPRTETPA